MLKTDYVYYRCRMYVPALLADITRHSSFLNASDAYDFFRRVYSTARITSITPIHPSKVSQLSTDESAKILPIL